MSKKIVFSLIAAGLFTAVGAHAATQNQSAQPFEQQVLQERGDSGLDRLECQTLLRQGLKQPAYCLSR